MYVLIVRVYLSSPFVYRQEHRFDTGSRLSHQACRSGWCDRQTSNIPASVLHHFCDLPAVQDDTADQLDVKVALSLYVSNTLYIPA